MRYKEFITESQQTTINKLYNGNFPDRDESFWDEVSPSEFDQPLSVKVLPKYKLAIMLQSQYRVEHLDEILDMMDEEQQEVLQRYMADPSLSSKVILLSGDRIIDGNHRALAAAMKGVPINYVDLADLDEQGVMEDTGTTLDPDYFMNEGCGIYAVALALNEPGSQIYIISNKTGETWSKSFPYEITHVFANVPNKGQYDIRGKRSPEVMASDFSLTKPNYSIKGPFDPKEFFKKFMGISDTKPLYGTIKDVKQVQGQLKDTLDEMALSTYKTMGDFTKPGPFQGADKKLVPHPKNIEKATKFFEQTPYDFRLFFSNISGTGKYSEHGPMSADDIRKVFGPEADSILQGSEDAITVVFVGNKGDRKVMLTPWMMAHRFGHAIQAGVRKNRGWSAWGEAEKHFFSAINATLAEHYGKADRGGASSYMGRPKSEQMNSNLTPEYNALFNAIGTQRSSRSGEIKRPYEFLYELFAQYLGTGKITFNPLPANLGYGRQTWGTPSQYMNIKPEYRDPGERAEATQILANDMTYMFDDVLSSSVGQIFVM